MTAVQEPTSTLGWMLYWGLQPALLVICIGGWLMDPDNGLSFLIALATVQVILGVAEHYLPARPAWVTSAREKIQFIAIFLVVGAGAVVVGGLYAEFLAAPLDAWRERNGLNIWPHELPLVVQLFLVFFLSEFFWYWIHRLEHRFYFVWRLSGHGAHHSFKRLGALNAGLNHPLELFFLAIPPAIVEFVFGSGIASAGAAILTITQASIAHTNLRMNTKVIGWLFTTNRYHIRHHSAVLEESNTNYGCAAILWDRVFGTFVDSDIVDAGTGPTEPTLWQKFVMPVKEPTDTAIAPG